MVQDYIFIVVFYITCLSSTRFVEGFPSLMHGDVRNEQHTVITFAFSGLRWDSLELFNIPSLSHLKNLGVVGKRKIDAFQTESLPSFVTMVTGKYPESHGMMCNRMKSLRTGDVYDVKNTDPKWWQNVEPVWIRNLKNGSSSALCYWPGHEVSFPHSGANATLHNCSNVNYTDPFKELVFKGSVRENAMPFEERVKQAQDWLTLKKDRPTFIGVYFEEPFNSISQHGVNSPETKAAIERVENSIKSMILFLKKINRWNTVNFVVTGETGFTELKERQEIYLEDYISKTLFSTYDIIDDGPIMTIFPHTDEFRIKLLNAWSNAHKHMMVYDGKQLPANFHFSNANRTAPIILVADESWRIYGSRVVDAKKALMGFDAKFSSSHALFVAHGPAFQEKVSVDAIGNIDVYAMLCLALKIIPNPNSGNMTIVNSLMKKEEVWYIRIAKKVVSSTTGLTVAVIVAFVLLFVALYLVVCSVYKTVGLCSCPKTALKINIKSPRKLEKGVKHLLSEDELSSDISDTDDELNANRFSRK